MYFVMTDRNGMVRLIPKNAIWAEVGVYKGDFSKIVIDSCSPSRYYLIDNWKFELAQHDPFGEDTENFANFRGQIHWQHYGDDANAHQEENFQLVKRRFAEV